MKHASLEVRNVLFFCWKCCSFVEKCIFFFQKAEKLYCCMSQWDTLYTLIGNPTLHIRKLILWETIVQFWAFLQQNPPKCHKYDVVSMRFTHSGPLGLACNKPLALNHDITWSATEIGHSCLTEDQWRPIVYQANL